jgi:hypothetical protein
LESSEISVFATLMAGPKPKFKVLRIIDSRRDTKLSARTWEIIQSLEIKEKRASNERTYRTTS